MSAFNTLNKATLIGRLGRDPELKTLQNGNTVATFSVATNSSFKQGDQWEEKTEWHNVVVFGKSAEAVGKFLAKGSTCYVEGRIQTRKYTTQEGQERSVTEIVAMQVKFLDSKQSQNVPQQAVLPVVEKNDYSGVSKGNATDSLPF